MRILTTVVCISSLLAFGSAPANAMIACCFPWSTWGAGYGVPYRSYYTSWGAAYAPVTYAPWYGYSHGWRRSVACCSPCPAITVGCADCCSAVCGTGYSGACGRSSGCAGGPIVTDPIPQADPGLHDPPADSDDRIDRRRTYEGDGDSDRTGDDESDPVDEWRERGDPPGRFDVDTFNNDSRDSRPQFRDRADPMDDDRPGFLRRANAPDEDADATDNAPDEDADATDEDSGDGDFENLLDDELRYRPPMRDPVKKSSDTDDSGSPTPDSSKSESRQGPIIMPPPVPDREISLACLSRGIPGPGDVCSGHRESVRLRRLARNPKQDDSRGRSWAGYERTPRRHWIGVPPKDGRRRI